MSERVANQVGQIHIHPERANSGLLYERYLPLWTKQGSRYHLAWKRSEQDGGLYPYLKNFTQDFKKGYRQGQEQLDALHQRHNERLGSEITLSRTLRTTWRLAIGLGGDHPTENGFTFDPLLGCPYLPGTAVKGLCRRGGVLAAAPEEQRLRLLGAAEGRDRPGSHNPPKQRGALRFFAAYPLEWPRLEVDITNVHYRSYYRRISEQRRGWETASADERDDPVPVYFLTVAADTDFVFRVQGIPSSHVATLDELEEALTWLEYALEILGAGAKTAAGYGQMRVISEAGAGGSEESTTSSEERIIAELHQRIASLEARDMGQVGGLISRIEAIPDSEAQAALTQALFARCNKAAKAKLHTHATLGQFL